MKLFKLIITLVVLHFAISVKAQNEQDVLRYSFTNAIGSARSMACGNAFGALGADYSSLVTNPAGLARYRSSEMGITANFFNVKTNSFYINNTQTDNKFNLNINNAGLAVAVPTGNSTGWRYVNLGFGTNRIANFNKSIYFEGINNKSSIVQHFEQSANGTDTSNLGSTSGSFLAWYQYLINNESGSANQYYSDFTNDSSYSLRQRISIEQGGGMSDISLAISGNYDDKVYIGGSLNFYKVKFTEANTFIEEVLSHSVAGYQKLSYLNNLSTSGSGVGAKIGVIALPTEYLRLGLAFHTPSRIYLTDNYNSTLSSTINNISNSKSSPDGTYDYSITIPGKIAASAAFLYDKRGFISVDFEHVDYRDGKLNSGSGNISALDTFNLGVNNKVRSLYRAANNIRIGAEYTFDEVYCARAGVGFTGSPYNTEVSGPSKFKTSIPFISCGFGIRNGNYFLDAALVKNFATNYYAPYTLNPSGQAKYYTSETQSVATNFTVSIGLKF
ncbi:MAG: outer membrane protein transport protein [Bacteroidetes bacterium]|nr:outer membrane protein transport protein [Bacteroidota bacterium]